MMPLPLCSIAIPCYNKSSTIARSIQSVKAQTLTNLEAIIVDDGSIDNSKEVILAAIKNDRRFRYIYQDNQHVAAARNRGFRESTGVYFCCLDADDAMAPLFLELCVKALEKDRSMGIAYSGLHYILPDGGQGLSSWPNRFDYNIVLKGQNPIPTCNVARREVWERTGGQRSRYCVNGAGEEDGEMWLRAGSLGFNAVQIEPAATLVETHSRLKKELKREPTREEILADGQITGDDYELAVDSMFIYSWKSGQVSGDPKHTPVDYRVNKPWVTDGKHPFASLATPANRYSHAVSQYDEPIISVIIPCSPNHQQYLVDALDSLEAQTFRKWEAIVVFDGAMPQPDLLTAYPFVRWQYTDSLGAGAARNAGAKMARAKLLLFLDADDWLKSTALEKMYVAWSGSSAIITSDYVGHAFIDDVKEIAKLQAAGRLLKWDEKTKEAVVKHESFDFDCEEAQRQPRIYKNGQFYIWNLISSLVPKLWFDEVGGFDEKMESWEDWDLWIKLARNGKCFTRITEPLLNYRFYTGQRREIASADNDSARQLRDSLVQYMTEKYAGSKVMACSGCGQKRVQSNPAQMQAPQMAAMGTPMAQQQVSASDIVWVRLNDGNIGEHGITGVVTKQKYNPRKHGDVFKMLRVDAVAMPNHFLIVPDPNAKSVALEAPKIELPEPALIAGAEFAQWEKEQA